MDETEEDGLGSFLPAVSGWFRATFGESTPPQRQGWPVIASGRNVLLCAPTGSGKTLAAFLACLDHLWKTPRTKPGVRILYISPLKALNQDIERNLRIPLDGVLAYAESMHDPLAPIMVDLRSGDTSQKDRQRMVRRPPDIMITTPESLHLMLTSRARETLRSVTHVIIDEIHAVVANKRGSFLAILLERLEQIAPGFVRIGLSATQKPLEEVARFLGGSVCETDKSGNSTFTPRLVTIVDAGQRKVFDLEVSLPSRGVGAPPTASIWPAIESRLKSLIDSHRSTIVFANNRRIVERLTARLNELDRESRNEDAEESLPIARSHHGSLSPDARRQTEVLLKAGEIPAVVATASLELGIDMGAVDLVCQVESPGGVARGLQRVGRAGHLVGRTSKGRLLAKTTGDLIESAALVRAMMDGDVEILRVPVNALDILTQQIIACVALDRWNVFSIYDMIRSAYPYRDLSASAFDGVLKLASGRFEVSTFRDLKPRISWDRVHNELRALPGTKRLAVSGGGAIPDTGQYPVYLGEGGPRLGELDEEFVLERRVGETFVLGTSTWKIVAIEVQKVVVEPAQGRSALMPFWRGEAAGRTSELGAAVGRLCREITEKRNDDDVIPWLIERYRVDMPSARSLLGLIHRQIRHAGAVPHDRQVLVETFKDPSGETGLVILTPFGHKRHYALKLAIGAVLRDRLGIEVASAHADEGIVFRLPGMDNPPLDVFRGLSANVAFSMIRRELIDSALFGLRFRQNVGRALLMPKPDPSKRTPLWLQRLRAKDLLQAVRKFPDFPIVIETYRECLDEDLDLPGLRTFLDAIETGEIIVATKASEMPSPFASELIFQFTRSYLWEWDSPVRPESDRSGPIVDEAALDALLAPESRRKFLDPNAIGLIENRLRGVGRPPRTADEMAEWLREVGDLAESEMAGPMERFVLDLQAQSRAVTFTFENFDDASRWINAEELELYQSAFAKNENESQQTALMTIIRRYLRTHALVTINDLTKRYPIDRVKASDLLESLGNEGVLIPLGTHGDGREEWADSRNYEEVRRLSIAIRRREAVAVSPEAFAAFVARRQCVDPETKMEGDRAVEVILERLQGIPSPIELWEDEILSCRIRGFRRSQLDAVMATGSWRWRADDAHREEIRAAIVLRDFAGSWPIRKNAPELSPLETSILNTLIERGAAFTDEIASSLNEPPARVRIALQGLIGQGRVSNDRLDPVREGSEWSAANVARASAPASTRTRPRLGSFRRQNAVSPEGRWSPISIAEAHAEESILAWAEVLMDRYGVLAREIAELDPWAPEWREIQPHLARLELRGELRRGYFVEGMSGVQYALAETAEELAKPVEGNGSAYLVNTLDPSNLYGSGAPFDVPLLEGGTARLPRNSTNYLVMKAGRPIVICESYGKRLTGLASATEAEIREGLALIPSLARPSRRVLKVELYNAAAPTASPAEPWLAEAGFVRDPPGMAYYAGW